MVDAGDFFYCKHQGMFHAMPAYWKNLMELQRCEVATLIGSFYDKSCAIPTKLPCLVCNLKKYLNLGYINLDDAQDCAAYLATCCTFGAPDQGQMLDV